MIYVVVGILAYFIGSVSFGVVISRKFAGFDVREKGSKGAGATNMLRSVGKKAAVLTLICDIAKGIVAILLATLIGKIWKCGANIELLKYIAGLAVILGHTFPIFFEFRGGKGVATALGVLFLVQWDVALICLVFAILMMAITKMVSVGSILAAILFPILVIFMETDNNIWITIVSILIALLVLFNHRTNIQRIKNGNENKLSFKSAK